VIIFPNSLASVTNWQQANLQSTEPAPCEALHTNNCFYFFAAPRSPKEQHFCWMVSKLRPFSC